MSGERFIAVRVDKMGATESLKPNLVGLSNMAHQFLPKDYKFVEVLEATREIVSGVRYELLVAALNDNNEAVLCRIVLTEITWKLTAWGEKQRVLNYSNCTSNATTDDHVPNPTDFSFNPLFASKTNSITDDDLKLIESQIIIPKKTEKSGSEMKVGESFDLSNLEAMIIPVNSLPKSVKTKLSSPTQNVLNDHTQKPSESQIIGDCNHSKPFDEGSSSDVVQDTQIKTDSIDDATNTKLDKSSHEFITEPLSSTVLLNEKSKTEKKADTFESVQEGNRLRETKFEEIASTSGDGDNNQPSILPVTVEPLTLNDKMEHSDLVTSTETSKQTQMLLTIVNETEPLVPDTALLLQHVEEKTVEAQPKIESVSSRIDDSIVPTTETIIISETRSEVDRAINEATESFERQENSFDRTKRDINTEKLFLKHLANEALERLDHIDSDNLKRIALDVIHAKKTDQENGAVYVLKVRTANSDCSEESDDLRTCLENIRKDTIKICLIEVKIIIVRDNNEAFLSFFVSAR